MSDVKKRRVAILGGGVAGLATAFELTDGGRARDVEVTVHERRHVLGGKGGSTRNLARGGRFEEHGLHVWLGFYENAFRLLRRAWDEYAPPADAPLRRWRDAFEPIRSVDVFAPDGTRRRTGFPEEDALPGDGDEFRIDRLFTYGLARALRGARVDRARSPATRFAHVSAAFQLAVGRHLARPLRSRIAPLEAAATALRNAAARVSGLEHAWTDLELLLTLAVALAREGLLAADADLARLDEEEFRAFLLRHGASRRTVDSELVTAIYALAFSAAHPLAAGTGVLITLRTLLGWKGAFYWKMNAGMGEAVIAPLYEVLRARGVRFRFFERVDEVLPDSSGKWLESVRLTRTRHVRAGEYQATASIDGVRCFPTHVDESQLDERAPEKLELRAGRDFDDVVLAVPVAAMPPIVGALCDRDPRWPRMLASVGAVPTQAVQYWLDRPVADTGWEGGVGIVTGLPLPIDSWAAMDQLVRFEGREGRVRGVLYGCGSLDSGTAAGNVEAFERDVLARLAPGLSNAVIERLVRQNDEPSERYTMAFPGTTAPRLAAHDSGFEGLILAGDWVRTGSDAGCIEAAVMSGRQAARAIVGDVGPISGEAPQLAALFASRPRSKGAA